MTLYENQRKSEEFTENQRKQMVVQCLGLNIKENQSEIKRKSKETKVKPDKIKETKGLWCDKKPNRLYKYNSLI